MPDPVVVVNVAPGVAVSEVISTPIPFRGVSGASTVPLVLSSQTTRPSMCHASAAAGRAKASATTPTTKNATRLDLVMVLSPIASSPPCEPPNDPMPPRAKSLPQGATQTLWRHRVDPRALLQDGAAPREHRAIRMCAYALDDAHIK